MGFAPDGKIGYRSLPIALLFVFLLLLGTVSPVKAATVFCSDFGGVIDGFDPEARASIDSSSTIGIDMHCTIKNFPESDPLDITNINFNFPQQQSYYIVFDNVYYPGNMSCNDPTQSDFWIYWAPGGYNNISEKCQAAMVPVDALIKHDPVGQQTATIGTPFTYTLTLPVMGQLDYTGFVYFDTPDDTDITNVVIADDLTASGAALSYVTNAAYLVEPGTGARTPLNSGQPLVAGASSSWLADHPGVLSDTTQHLVFSYENNPDLALIPAGYQLEIELTVLLDNNPAVNTPATQFSNTAEFWFDKTINGTDIPDLHGQPGSTLPMTIVAPYLKVSKESTVSNLNVGTPAPFQIDVENTGGSDAWNATITDRLPAGMCAYNPTDTSSGPGVTARIEAADGSLISELGVSTDYTVAYDACELSITLLATPAARIGPNQHLIISYEARLDAGISEGTYTNVAGATEWFNDGPGNPDRVAYARVLTDGTPEDDSDHEDAYTITAAVAGYYFLKSVENLTTGTAPAAGAFPGDTLRYTLQLQNFTLPELRKITIIDELDAVFVPGTLSLINSDLPVTANLDVGSTGGANGTGSVTITGLTLPSNTQYEVHFDVTLASPLEGVTEAVNQASLEGTDSNGDAWSGVSDDPYTGGPALLGSSGDPTRIAVQAPGSLLKENPSQTTVTVGERFAYRITVPEVPVDVPLYDVRILDGLNDSAADLRFIRADVLSGGTWSLSNTGPSDKDLVIEDIATGIDIPSGGQAVIEVTVELENSGTNQRGLWFGNTATYTYSRINGNTEPPLAGGADSPDEMIQVVEPDAMTSTKDVRFVTPAGKAASDPATVGDVLEYVVTVPNTGGSTAFDVNVVDSLPAPVALVPGSANATINGIDVADFRREPTVLSGGELAWGRQNGDESLDIPSGQSLVLTYRVTVLSAAEPSIINGVHVDWTSQQDALAGERTGDGCPNVTAPDDYCYVPPSVTVSTLDNTSIGKTYVEDTYAEAVAGTDPIVRVGDSVTYDLTLNLQEYTTRNVVVEDVLPQGLALESFSLIGGPEFSYTLSAQPAAGDTGTLIWNFGDITNTPSGDDTPIDPLVIRYTARVLTDAPTAGVDYATAIARDNAASLAYSGGDPAIHPERLTATARIEVRQPQMSAISKVDRGSGRTGSGTPDDPYEVSLATDVMDFQLESCNGGLAPAYGVTLTDVLADALDETSLSTPVVSVGGTVLTAGTDYLYTPPGGRGGTMRFVLDAPVDPGECVTVDYRIGFHTDLTSETAWSNEARLLEYGSLPADGRLYEPTDVARVWMTNRVSVQPLSKTRVSPAETTIGELVEYQIQVPAQPVNAALDNVVVTDPLHAALVYVSTTALDSSGAPVSLTESVVSNQVQLTIPRIPAGDQVTITLTARVDNNDQANAGTRIDNSASYTYTGMPDGSDTSSTSEPLSIVEPWLTVTKSVPATLPHAGDLLTYTLTLAAAGTGDGDNYSNVFDITLEDTLGLGLLYEHGTATIDGAVLADPAINGGDGVSGEQNLTWAPAEGIDIDIVEGDSVTITYQVRVLDSVVPGQALTNSVIGRWSGLDGDQGAIERTGSGTPIENDYFTPAAITELWIGDNTSLSKVVVEDSYAEPNLGPDPIMRVGDTVSYDLTLNLQEGTTQSIVVEDVLPQGLALESFSLIGGPEFSYTLSAQPAAGDTGTLIWNFGDITNTPSGDDTPIDPLVIRYTARVLADAPTTGVDYATAIARDNAASLAYSGGDPAIHPERLTATARIEVRQPQMSAISKIDRGSGRTGSGIPDDPFEVSLATDVMDFQLESCNGGLAPAYGVTLTDVLADALDETSLSTPVVSVGGTVLTAGTDYIYTPPGGRGGTMGFVLDAPVDPGECVTVDYRIGFHTDLTSETAWSNEARLLEYGSLPADGRLYEPTDVARVWMTNRVSVQPLSKTRVSAAETTIGELVEYQIQVPAQPVNAALDNVVVTDPLHAALVYVSTTALDSSGAPVSLTESVVSNQVQLTITRIPAGDQVTITLTARVDNNDQANAGTRIDNSASYTYTGMPGGSNTSSTSEPLTIVEPVLAITKTITNVSHPGLPPNAGDILRYSINLTAGGGAQGDHFSDVFDVHIEDSLSPGLAYQSETASVDGTGNLIDEPDITGDGTTTGQTLTWGLSDATADIDVVEGTTVTVGYDVVVLDSVMAGQALANTAVAQWTGLDGDSGFERNGSGTPELNDYITEPVTQTLTTELAISFTKLVVNVTTGEDPGVNAQPGDALHYTLVVTNQSVAPLANGALVDELAPEFTPGSLQVISISDADADATHIDATGGSHGTGLLDLRDLTLGAQGEPGDTLIIEFEAILAPSIPSGTVVANQAHLSGDNLTSVASTETATLISSAPQFEFYKSSADIDGGSLAAGDTLRYTLTIRNIGTEDATNVSVRDRIPDFTRYVTGSTRLNGSAVADDAGVSPLQNGMLINAPAPEETTAGFLGADATETTNVATVTFDVTVNADVVEGTEIVNQGFVNGSGVGSGPFIERRSDDPTVNGPDDPIVIGDEDPTRDIVGDLPQLDATKTVTLTDNGTTPDVVDAGDTLRYTMTISNFGTVPASSVLVTDAIPDLTGYVAGTTYLNGTLVPDPSADVSALEAGLPVNAAGSESGTIPPGESATVTFDVEVAANVNPGDPISNQGYVSSPGTNEPTDADGNDANGDEPTIVYVGSAQQVAIAKRVFVVDGGAAQAGGQLDYEVRVTNTGTVTATGVSITDDLSPLLGLVSYVDDGSTALSINGVSNPSAVTYAEAAQTLTAGIGDLASGGSATLRFRVQIASPLDDGTLISNTGEVTWNTAYQAQSTADVAIQGMPGYGTLGGNVWHDADFDNVFDSTERNLPGWIVDLYRNEGLIGSAETDGNGHYQFSGVPVTATAVDQYEVRFTAPGATASTAKLGLAHSQFSNDLHRISEVAVTAGSNLQSLNLPITPNGIVYNSVMRTPIAGATLTMFSNGAEVPSSCFGDPAQQGQVTSAQGYYKFDLILSDTDLSCLAGGDYTISVTPPASGYSDWPSRIIPPATDEGTDAFSVPECAGGIDDAISETPDQCEVQTSEFAPSTSVRARSAGTTHHLHLTLDNNPTLWEGQIFNNHIPVDPELDNAIAITKTAALINVSRGEHVPYTITLRNTLGTPLQDLSLLDAFPAGFKYVEGSARINGQPAEPDVNGLQLAWNDLELGADSRHTIKMLFIVGAGVSEGEYVNRAWVINRLNGEAASGEASATVRVVPDPTFDCTDITGKVFDDANLDGVQDPAEKGLPGVRLATARGLIAKTDQYGRFHITCAATPDESRGSNFILKLDDRSLPTGYRITTENPRVQRVTRGKMVRFNFGATLHRVVRLDVADGVFEPDATEMRLQWKPRMERLIEELRKAPLIIRLSYLADVEEPALVERRLGALEQEIATRWEELNCCYPLMVETEVFWRRGAPPER